MHWIYLIHEFHNFHDILIYWDAPVEEQETLNFPCVSNQSPSRSIRSLQQQWLKTGSSVLASSYHACWSHLPVAASCLQKLALWFFLPLSSHLGYSLEYQERCLLELFLFGNVCSVYCLNQMFYLCMFSVHLLIYLFKCSNHYCNFFSCTHTISAKHTKKSIHNIPLQLHYSHWSGSWVQLTNSMIQNKSWRFLFLCCSEEGKSYWFGMTWLVSVIQLSQNSNFLAKIPLRFQALFPHFSSYPDSRCIYMEHCNRFKSSIRMKIIHVNTSIGIKMPKSNEILIGLRGVG